MPLSPQSLECTVLFLIGTALLIVGVTGVFKSKSLPVKALLGMCMADAGFILYGLSSGGSSGATGAVLLVIFNGLARCTAYICLVRLCKEAGGDTLEKLRGIGQKKPTLATIFAFSMLVSLEVSVFLTTDGRFYILHSLFATGHTLLPFLLVAVNVLLLYTTIKIVHPIWLEVGPYERRPQYFRMENALPVGMGLGLIFIGLCGESLAHYIADISKDPGSLPNISFVWHATTWLPFLGAIGAWFAGRTNKQLRNAIATGSMALAFLSLAFMGDVSPLGYLYVCVTTGIGLIVTIYSCGYIKADKAISSDSYFFFMLIVFSSLSGLATATNMGTFYVFWEMMTISSYVIIAYPGTGESSRGAIKYFLMCAIPAAVMLPGLLLLSTSGGSLDFAALAAAAPSISFGTVALIAILVLVGFGVKAGLVPGHSWLPEAHPAAPSSFSAPLSGVLTKAGFFGLVQILLVVLGVGALNGTGQTAETVPTIGICISLFGLVSLLYGEWKALFEKDLKRLLAYSTIGQIGEIALTIGLCTYLATTGALLHLINHAIMKDLLFLGAGVIIMQAGSRNLDDLKGLGRAMPFTATCMVIGLFSIMGLPPFAGFTSKFMMLYAIADKSPFIAGLMLLASMAGVIYYMRILKTLIFEPYTGPKLDEGPISMRIAVGTLAALCILFGLFPGIGLGLASAVSESLALSGKIAVQTLPSMVISWHSASLLLILGAAVPYYLRNDPVAAGRASAWLMVAAAALAFVFSGDMDTLSWMMALAVPAVGATNLFYASSYMSHSHTQWRFYVFFLIMTGGLVGVVTSSDLFNFFLFWEIMSSWSLYFVIVHEENEASLREGYKYFFFNVLGACFLFLGVVLVINWSGSGDFGAIKEAMAGFEPWQLALAFFTLATGFVMKAAQLSFRIDIQMHPATAPTPVSGYISSVLLKSAIFGLVKLFMVFGGAGLVSGVFSLYSQEFWMDVVVWIGGITIVMAALFAVFQDDLKLVFIYSTVSQIGYMVAGVALGTSLGVAGGLLHLFNHMIFKNLLFLVAGAVLFSTHKHSVNSMGGLASRMPITMALFAVGALCVVGVPPSNGFTSKWILYHALMEQGYVMVAILSLVGSLITLAYIAKVLHTVYLGQLGEGMEKVEEVPKGMRTPMIILAVAAVVTSVFPGIFLGPLNWVLAELALKPLDIAFFGIASGKGAWNATTTALLVFVAFYGGHKVLQKLVDKERSSPVHICGNEHDTLNLKTSTHDLYTAPSDLLGKLKRFAWW